jgi:hypothetical protein
VRRKYVYFIIAIVRIPDKVMFVQFLFKQVGINSGNDGVHFDF